jgi:hypothetical protein
MGDSKRQGWCQLLAPVVDGMKHLWFIVVFAVPVLLHAQPNRTVPITNSAIPALASGTNPVPLSMALLVRLRESLAPDLGIRTTNGEAVATFLDVVDGGSGAGAQGQPKFAAIKPYDNVLLRSGFEKGFLVVPWNLLQFHPTVREIRIQATVQQLQTAPLIESPDVPRSLSPEWMGRILAHFQQNEAAAANVAQDVGRVPLADVGETERQKMGKRYAWLAVALALCTIIGLAIFRSRTRTEAQRGT